jgi:hypothetical protein
MREKALSSTDFAAAVADYSRSEIDEMYVRKCYEAQIAAIRHGRRDPLPAKEFVAGLVVNGDADVSEADRDRLREIYAEQIEIATELAGDSRV